MTTKLCVEKTNVFISVGRSEVGRLLRNILAPQPPERSNIKSLWNVLCRFDGFALTCFSSRPLDYSFVPRDIILNLLWHEGLKIWKHLRSWTGSGLKKTSSQGLRLSLGRILSVSCSYTPLFVSLLRCICLHAVLSGSLVEFVWRSQGAFHICYFKSNRWKIIHSITGIQKCSGWKCEVLIHMDFFTNVSISEDIFPGNFSSFSSPTITDKQNQPVLTLLIHYQTSKNSYGGSNNCSHLI